MSKRILQNIYKGAGTSLELMPHRRALLGAPTLPPENAPEQDLAKIRRDWQRVGRYIVQGGWRVDNDKVRAVSSKNV